MDTEGGEGGTHAVDIDKLHKVRPALLPKVPNAMLTVTTSNGPLDPIHEVIEREGRKLPRKCANTQFSVTNVFSGFTPRELMMLFWFITKDATVLFMVPLWFIANDAQSMDPSVFPIVLFLSKML